MNQKVTKARQSLVAVIILAAFTGFASCEKYKIMPYPFDPAKQWSFKTDIQPIFNANCNTSSCHGGARQPDLSEARSFNSLTTGRYIQAPYETSALYLKMNGSHPTSSFSDSNDKLKILNWITQGAMNN
jgi:hypothetical protein